MTDVKALQDALAKVRARFVATLPSRRSVIEKLLEEIAIGQPSSACIEEAHLHLHQIAGTAATLGFVKLGGSACAGEELILDEDHKDPDLQLLEVALRNTIRLIISAEQRDHQ